MSYLPAPPPRTPNQHPTLLSESAFYLSAYPVSDTQGRTFWRRSHLKPDRLPQSHSPYLPTPLPPPEHHTTTPYVSLLTADHRHSFQSVRSDTPAGQTGQIIGPPLKSFSRPVTPTYSVCLQTNIHIRLGVVLFHLSGVGIFTPLQIPLQITRHPTPTRHSPTFSTTRAAPQLRPRLRLFAALRGYGLE